MAERLTEKDSIENKRYVLNSEDNQIILTSAKLKNGFRKTYYYGKPIDKLAKFEDIMEKYHCNDIEELDKKLANFDNFMKGNKFETIEDLQNALNGKFIEVFDEKNKIWQDMVKNLTKTEQDRDTWKRACELACVDYFYQQAKKEGEQK